MKQARFNAGHSGILGMGILIIFLIAAGGAGALLPHVVKSAPFVSLNALD